jgi:CheY-like chemotaxis protein
VLIVEDHAEARSVLRVLLELCNFQVEEAPNGPQGVRKALAWQPDVAVVDIELPLFNGYEVARQIRTALADRIRLVALTSYGQPADKQRALEAGFDSHLTKPADPRELVRHLHPA